MAPITKPDVAIQLYRIVQEAVTNSVKHGKAKNISIHLRVVKGRLKLSVADDGVGIADERSGGGMGLRSYERASTRYWSGADHRATQARWDVSHLLFGRQSGRKGKSIMAVMKQTKTQVLLVDDHPMIRKGLANLIKEDSNLMVCGEAGNSRQALAMIAEVKPNLAIVDISLGGGDGIEFIKEDCTGIPECCC